MDKALLPTGFCTDGLGAVPGTYMCRRPSLSPHSLQAALKHNSLNPGSTLLFVSRQMIYKGFATQLESLLLEIL